MLNISLSNVYKWLLAILMLQFLLIPKILMELKGICIFILILILLTKRMAIGAHTYIILIYVFWNIISFIHGTVNGYGEYAVKRVTVDILWPMCYAILSGYLLGKNEIDKIRKILIVSTFFLSFLDIILIVSNMLGITEVTEVYNLINLNPVSIANYEESHVDIRIDHQYLYAFLTPFTILSYLKKDSAIIDGSDVSNLSKEFILLTCIMSVVVSILIGVAGLWLAVASGLFFYFIKEYKITFNKKTFVNIINVIFIFIAVAFSLYNFEPVRSELLGVGNEIAGRLFSGEVDPSDLTRILQANAMIETWLDNPLLGGGTGMPVYYFRPSMGYGLYPDNELSYLVILYQKGGVGMLLFLIVVYKAYLRLRMMNKIGYFTVPFSISMIAFLIPNAFNPYFANISTSWIVFLPFIISDKAVSTR